MLRQIATGVATQFSRGMQQTTLRAYSMEGVRGYSEREAVEERLYFSKEDERSLRKLLSKAKKQADTDSLERDAQMEKEMRQLRDILGKYSVSEADLKEVILWKHADDGH